MPENALLAARETLRDVGTTATAGGEYERSSPAHVARVNLKRLQESLRSLEEYGKVFGSSLGHDLEEHVVRLDVEGVVSEVHVGVVTTTSQSTLQPAPHGPKLGMRVIILSGKDGGKLRGLADAEIIVPHFGYADRIQEIHIKVIHILIGLVEKGMQYS